ncbi:MAG TPA: hypothetical protein ENN31_02125 [Candidatus Vogelbacteria bacterium]|nr:hypothetical protein [Candidatus Vogelbacteria bacterium]
MYPEVLNDNQKALLPSLSKFRDECYLVGGTAIALYLGHRRSIDFDFAMIGDSNLIDLRRKIKREIEISEVFIDKKEEFTFITQGVKITFFEFPFEIKSSENLDNIIFLPDLLTLAAMKAYTLGRRAKWKDYVDLYFIIKNNYSVADISDKGKEIFRGEFNTKIFRTQLAYFEDIDYSEKIDFLPGREISDSDIKRDLIEFSLS